MENFNHYVVHVNLNDRTDGRRSTRIESAFPGPYSNAIVKIQEYLNTEDFCGVQYDSNKHSAHIYAFNTFDEDEEVTVIKTL